MPRICPIGHRLQVESPSSGLGRLVCLALTSKSGDAGAAAAAAGVLDDETFFCQFFERLVGGNNTEERIEAHIGDADESDGRILEQVSLCAYSSTLSSCLCLCRGCFP